MPGETTRKGKTVQLERARGPVTPVAGGILVTIWVTPRAAVNCISELGQERDGAIALKVAVKAVPEDGKANAVVVRLLARAWKLPQRALSIVAGSGARRKILFITGEPIALTRHLQEWVVSQRS